MREIAVADVHDALERERRRDARREEHPGRVARAERTQTREEDTKEEREEEHQGSSCPPRRAVEDDRAQFAKRDGTLEVPRRERAERERKRHALPWSALRPILGAAGSRSAGARCRDAAREALTCARRRLGAR